MRKTKTGIRVISVLLALLVVAMMLPMAMASAESAKVAPEANVSALKPITLTAADHNYKVWPTGDNTVDRPLNVMVNFKSTDTLEECLAGGYSDWIVDFNVKIEGLESDSFVADNCYLAGNYGEFGWYVIPLDGQVIEEGVSYPIVANYDSNLTYEDICKSVKDFTAAVYVDDAVLNANPDFKIELDLVMEDKDTNETLTVGSPITYTAKQLKGFPTADVTRLPIETLPANGYTVWPAGSGAKDIDRPLNAMVNFKATDTLAQCLAGGYSKWVVDFNVKVNGLANDSFVADNCYLAGNYGEYGWYVIPLDGKLIEEGVSYPIVANYDPNLTYKEICESVKDFIAAVYVDDAILEANPDFEIELTLVMQNPDNAEEKLTIDEPIVYNAEQLNRIPSAEITEIPAETIPANGYKVWPNNSGATNVDRPLDIAVNFKSTETLEECLYGAYSDWVVDFNVKLDGLANGSFVADNCYLAGNYGEYGWYVIPLDGKLIEEGVSYPIVANYDPNLTYKEICESVKDFTAAIYVDDAILIANPDFEIALTLVMTNPEDSDDTLTIDEPLVFTGLDILAIAENESTGKKYTNINTAISEAAGKNQTVKLLKDVTITDSSFVIPAGVNFDLNGKTLSTGTFFMMFGSIGTIADTSEGEGGLAIPSTGVYTMFSKTNAYMPIYDTSSNCYRLFSYDVVSKGSKAVGDNRLKFGYYLKFGSRKAYELLANDSANSGLSIVVSLTVDKGDGKASKFDYTCNNTVLTGYAKEMLKLYDANDYDTIQKFSITFTVAGLAKLPSETTITSLPTLKSTLTSVEKAGEIKSYTKP